MLKEERTSGGETGENNWARICDTCRSAACTVYCRADSAYLCTSCDARVHAANHVASRHERVWVCESCERAPAAFLCKADAASLCAACDAEIHSANPLARRHHRVPILPISGSMSGPMANHHPSETAMTDTENDMVVGREEAEDEDEDDEEAASWLLLNPGKNSGNNNNQNNGFFFDGEADEYLDLVEYNSSMENQFSDQYSQYHQDCGVPQKSFGGDGVVPLQVEESRGQLHHEQQSFQLAITYGSPGALYGSYNGSMNHSVSMSSMDIVVVPESTASDMAVVSQLRAPKGTTDLLIGPPIQMMPQLSPMDREARVLRYREKKKTRKFEKTIRYASRKAYAETRPRIKGRFAKRTDIEAEVDQAFSTTLMQESGYGIVPSF
ncbi:PREDICTED: zinc finger protein CONSTANS-LIKE 2-like [Tarenaya hassleriana]|uniref:Uncharacterized protein n=1 Tax=Tarenaya spinosa TaxID=228870 RepID=Q1KUP6_9ROSI|nr:PREDICTED: zinc finger protein CONSTANS-LIKE 2-like [Tarenaya hassleriana]ABD96940.1 hypothetical protein [Tarenaya spinosa]